MYRDFAAL